MKIQPNQKCLIPFVVTAISLAIVPLMLPNSLILVEDIMAFGLLALSFGVIFGYGGLLSLSQALYFGVAGYLFTFILKYSSLPAGFGALLAVCGGGIFSFLTGIIAVRLRGAGFLILTLIYVAIGHTLILTFRRITGGTDGLLSPVLNFNFFSFVSPFLTKYLIIGVVFLVAVGITMLITESRFGGLMMASRDNDQRMEFFGYDTTMIKLATFAFSGLLAATGGVVYVITHSFADPSIMSWELSAHALIWSFLGGIGTVYGPIIGVVTLLAAQNFVWTHTSLSELISGIILIAILLANSRGIIGIVQTAGKTIISHFRDPDRSN